MNKTSTQALEFLKKFTPLVKDVINSDIVLAAPFTLLSILKEQLKNTNIKLAAQNLFYEKEGAYTGEVSPLMVLEFADYVIIGHSERRKHFLENNIIINRKIKAALATRLSVIFCLGETMEERKINMTKNVLERQLQDGLSAVKDIKRIVIAYEPVWAIGSGVNATPEQAESAHFFLRGLLSGMYGKKIAEETRIIYGGSVSPENAPSILRMPDVDGCLPGGASLDPVKFSKIIKAL